MRSIVMTLALLALGSACGGTAHADRISEKPALVPSSSVYVVELVDKDGAALDAYQHRSGSYVHGKTGERYSIRVSNPTAARIEAVVSVDGLDVVDGETASFETKRGYVVPAFGSITIDGYRVSTEKVAAFRFSSVSASYAGRKGKARNVGVVGVAIFTELVQEPLVLPPMAHRTESRSGRGFELDGEMSAGGDAQESRRQVSKSAPAGAAKTGASRDSVSKERVGLGTAFGEQRQSVVRFSKFERANSSKPSVIAELRYNDAAGLQALGIRLRNPAPDRDELALRESASSFPNSHFAQPPR